MTQDGWHKREKKGKSYDFKQWTRGNINYALTLKFVELFSHLASVMSIPLVFCWQEPALGLVCDGCESILILDLFMKETETSSCSAKTVFLVIGYEVSVG